MFLLVRFALCRVVFGLVSSILLNFVQVTYKFCIEFSLDNEADQATKDNQEDLVYATNVT